MKSQTDLPPFGDSDATEPRGKKKEHCDYTEWSDWPQLSRGNRGAATQQNKESYVWNLGDIPE